MTKYLQRKWHPFNSINESFVCMAFILDSMWLEIILTPAKLTRGLAVNAADNTFHFLWFNKRVSSLSCKIQSQLNPKSHG